MLTQDDLNQIEQLMESVIEKRVPSIIDNRIKPLERDIHTVKKDVKILRSDVGTLKADVKVLKFRIEKVKEDSNAVISVFDDDYKSLEKRTGRIEKHLALSSA